MHKGLLLSKSNEDGDVWNVRIEGEDKDRQVNEEFFGRVVQAGSTKSSTGKHQTKVGQKTRGRPPKNKRSTSVVRKRAGVNEGSESNCTTSTLGHANDEKNNTMNNDSKSIKAKNKTSGVSRKLANTGRRKKRKNAMDKSESKEISIEKPAKQDLMRSDQDAEAEVENSSTTRVNTRSSSKKRNHSEIASPLTFTKKTGTKGRHPGRGGKRIRKMKGEEVEKVKFLTGTLYLYRGENPRVAFVRHF